MKKGLTRNGRLERITSLRRADVLDSGDLLRQALEVAGFLRYHDFRGRPDGYFGQLLSGLEHPPAEDGRMEPARALLYTFVHNLHEILDTFNRRWDDLPRWYLEDVGGIRDLPPEAATLWVAPQKSTRESVILSRGTGFVLRPSEVVFRPTEEMKDPVIGNATVERIVSVLYDRAEHGHVTSVEVRELPDGDQEPMFAGKRHLRHSASPGFIVSSSALMLREGRRRVHVRFETETHAFTDFQKEFPNISPSRLLSDIFHVEISTEAGWQTIEGAHVASGEKHPDNLTLMFTLPEEFPATARCSLPVHGVESVFPAIKVRLNLDAWLYPYSWIRKFILKRIVLEVEVRGLASLMVYNDLGRVDNSKPFHLFGLGRWFVLGNFEMAAKHTESFNLHIHWGQLPAMSLYDHYRAYGEGIDNRSFRLDAHSLRDHRWLGTGQWFLFGSNPAATDGTPLKEAPLSTESVLRNIPVGKNTPVTIDEKDYDYTIRSKSGFLRFSLAGPAMGFGEERYRTLFSERLIAGKKAAAEPLEPPIAPLAERITADYRASDRIDLRECHARPDVGFWYIHPLGIRQVYPLRRSPHLIPSLDGDAHILFGLSGVQGGECLHLWFDFAETERDTDPLPGVRWWWGDGSDWRQLPDDVILDDTTDNFSGAGVIAFDIPNFVDEGLLDEEGKLWFRATIVSGARHVPLLRRIVPGAIRLTAEGELHDTMADGPVELLKPVPGIAGAERLSFTEGRPGETAVEKLARISEWVTHRGRAVTPRDYERVVMQAFPEVAFARCFPHLDTRCGRGGVVTVLVIPAAGEKMTGTRLLRIERFLTRRVTPAVTKVDVINPRYEEILIRGMGEFRTGYSTGHCRARLKELCDRLIAPWRKRGETPVPGAALRYDDIAAAIRAQPYIASLDRLSIIRLGRSGEEHKIDELDKAGGVFHPTVPWAIFVPAREHLFISTDEPRFGIGEMSVEHHFII